jgi:flagellar hook-associated protein 1 FlgK
MAISNALTIGQRALLAAETALAVTGQNIANVGTPGYSRQVAELVSDPALRNGQGVLIGTGVHVARVSQVVDPLLQRRLLGAATARQEEGVRHDQLAALAAIVNDVDSPSVASALAAFFDAADALARNPAGLAERETFLARAGALAEELNRRSAAVAGLQRAVDDRLAAATVEANDTIHRLADLNRAIVAAEIGGQRANDLRDERARALERLAALVGISAVEDPRGAVTVSASNGVVLVGANAVVHTLGVAPGAPGIDGRPLSQPGVVTAGGDFIPLAGAFGQGEVAGLLDVRDGAVAEAASALDDFAVAVRDAANLIQTDRNARDLDGTPTTGAPIFDGTGAADLTVVLTDPRRVAAALSTEPGDNQNALRFADLRSAPQVGLGSVTFAAYLAGRQAAIGEQAARAEAAAAASDLLHAELETQRLALSGVNLNEELTNLLKYQRAFQAAARVISVNDAVLEDLINLI